MYFRKSNSFFHGIMFHHFHDDKAHKKSQGSISKDDFYKIIKFIGRKNILNAETFFEKFRTNKIKSNEVCITFDDAIKSQIDIALPVLEDLKIKAFYFVYTSLFEGKPDNLEIFRYFRMNYFEHINDFYKEFYKTLNRDTNIFLKKNVTKINEKKYKFAMYSIEDIKFRLIRDEYLSKDQYEKTMFDMIKKRNLKLEKLLPKLFFNRSDLKTLDRQGHLIGPHSHYHPTLIEKLNFDRQKFEYEKALNIISSILNKPKETIKWMSHPNGSYNSDSLKILKKLGIELGFKQIMKIEPEKGMSKINNSNLEIAREDHSNIMRLISE